MLPFREASKSAVERDFASVDLGKPGAEICSIHGCVCNLFYVPVPDHMCFLLCCLSVIKLEIADSGWEG